MPLFSPFNIKNSYRQSPDLQTAIKPVEEGYALIDSEQGKIMILNEVGYFIFNLLKKKHSAKQLIQKTKQQFTVTDGMNVKKDVLFFVRDLEKKKLIRRVD